jgi:DNA mismatch repair ATPase MutS
LNISNSLQSGFPYFQLDRFLKTLVQDMNRYVAISEEFPNDASQKAKSGGLLFDRRVTRVITPGTLIDEKFMDPWENNFLLSIHANADAVGQSMPPDPGSQKKCEAPVEREPVEIGVAWLDLSSGDFFTQKTELSSLSSVIARIGPREIVVGREFENTGLTSILKDGHHVVTFHAAAELAPAIDSVSMMKAGVTLDLTKFSEAEVKAGNSLVNYVTTQLQGSVPQLREPVSRHTEEYMMIDKNSLRALEIRSTLRNGTFEGSLLNVIRRTVTKSGTRLLSQRLSKMHSAKSLYIF